MKKEKIIIISPHVDDELYGCLGYMIKMSKRYHIDVVYLTESEDQTKRFKIVEKLYKPYDISINSLKMFKDGEGDQTRIKWLTTLFDDITENYDTILVNSISNHQDHNKIHEALMISLRTRPKLKASTVLEYDYCYNQLTVSQSGCITYYFDQKIYDEVQDIWKQFENAHPVSKSENHVTHFSKANLLNEFMGSYRGCPYAERFHVLKLDKYLKEW